MLDPIMNFAKRTQFSLMISMTEVSGLIRRDHLNYEHAFHPVLRCHLLERGKRSHHSGSLTRCRDGAEGGGFMQIVMLGIL